MSPRCEALTLHSTYSDAHRCSKRDSGVRKVGRNFLCAHHRGASSVTIA